MPLDIEQYNTIVDLCQDLKTRVDSLRGYL